MLVPVQTPPETAVPPCCVPGPGCPRCRDWLVRASADAPSDTPAPSRIDRILTAPQTGLPAFLAVLWLLLTAASLLAAPLQAGLERLVRGPAATALRVGAGWLGADGTWLEGLLVDGVLAGVGQVLTFVPLLGLVFAGLTALERSGYAARAVLAAAAPMRRMRLPGDAFLPLVVGMGCNVPSVAAAAALSDPRSRRRVALLVPLVTCSARLPVYLMVVAAVFAGSAGTVVFGMYAASLLLVAAVGRALPAPPDPGAASVCRLPALRVPRLSEVATEAGRRLRELVRGVAILVTGAVAVVWLLAAVPVTGGERFGSVPPERSVLGVAARTVSPLLAPAGIDDPRITVALVSGLVAKEAVVASLAPASGEGGSAAQQLRTRLRVASGGHPKAAGLAFLVFVLAYTPCLATLAAQRRAVGLRSTLTGLVLQASLAWLLAVAVFHAARIIAAALG